MHYDSLQEHYRFYCANIVCFETTLIFELLLGSKHYVLTVYFVVLQILASYALPLQAIRNIKK